MLFRYSRSTKSTKTTFKFIQSFQQKLKIRRIVEIFNEVMFSPIERNLRMFGEIEWLSKRDEWYEFPKRKITRKNGQQFSIPLFHLFFCEDFIAESLLSDFDK